jgi:hypothetical protein
MSSKRSVEKSAKLHNGMFLVRLEIDGPSCELYLGESCGQGQYVGGSIDLPELPEDMLEDLKDWINQHLWNLRHGGTACSE